MSSVDDLQAFTYVKLRALERLVQRKFRNSNVRIERRGVRSEQKT
jgi:hypothetical protein